ncbi:hypothetical protein DVH24_011747 [Malus domestica]|uniref:Uncharacterized protein n=1 Tax=Malus domestica TaxID=3750 RepID=A0A498K119_MALDO|nr:hypothetical protein DVH24_011747 [Malus domestica]
MEPDKQTYAYAVSVAATQSNLKLDSHVETAPTVMHLKNIDLAFHIFEGTTNKDVVLWTAMMSLRSPSSATIASALAACAQLGSFDMGTSVHG